MYTPKMTWVKSQIQPQHLELVDFENSQRLALLQAVIEGLSDGILIINEQGELGRVCKLITKDEWHQS